MMNHYQALDIPEATEDIATIDAAYRKAQGKYQTMLQQGIGEQQRLAREMMNGELDRAYETLSDPGKRQRYLRNLKLSQEAGIPVGDGRVKVSFSLSNGHADHEFLVVENPVRHPLEMNGLRIESLQEYVCRAWEDPDLAVTRLEDRSLERWMYYAAREEEIAKALRFWQWEPQPTPAQSLLAMTVDLLQTKYPTPILPRSPGDLLQALPQLTTPTWRVTPALLNFGLLSGNRDEQAIRLHISSWGEEIGGLQIKADHPAVRLDLQRLESEGFVFVRVDVDSLQRGQLLKAAITITSARWGSNKIPLCAARPNRMLGNDALAHQVNRMAGMQALEIGEYGAASGYLWAANEGEGAEKADFELLKGAYRRHDWLGVMRLARRYHDRYGRRKPEVQVSLIEALRFVGGAMFQLGEHRRSLEHLAALASESAFLQRQDLLERSWTAQPEAQVRLNLQNPKEDWVAVTERYGLNWTHSGGRGDRSHYAGEVPLDLSARRLIWSTNGGNGVQAPLLAYEGMLVVRSADQRSVLGLDAASGAEHWRHIGDSKLAAPVAGGDCVYVANASGGLFALNIITGQRQWYKQLRDGQDVALAYDGGLLFVGEGQRFVLFDAQDGEELGSFDELKAWGGLAKANPVNLLVTDECCLFQLVGGPNPSMVFADLRHDNSLKFDMPLKGSAMGALARSLFGSTSSAAATWAAWEGEIYMPYMVTMEIECRQKYVDSDGKQRESVEREQWGELHFFVYDARSNERLAHIYQLAWGTAYEENGNCRVSMKSVTPAAVCAVTPTYAKVGKEGNVLYPPDPERPLHRLIAAAFDSSVYYWIVTDKVVKRIGSRRADGPVQAIAYGGLYDMVTTSNSMSTSFVGNVSDGNSTAFFFPKDMGALSGPPAIYGDVIYVTTGQGWVVAVGR